MHYESVKGQLTIINNPTKYHQWGFKSIKEAITGAPGHFPLYSEVYA